MEKHELYGSKVYMALRKLPAYLIPKIIAYLLRQYNRYGLAELVEACWDANPEVEDARIRGG